jgi:predicted porin
LTDRIIARSICAAAMAVMASLLFARSAAADVTVFENDGWTVFMNGRIQTFGNYNDGQGQPRTSSQGTIVDGNGTPTELRGGGIDRGAALTEWPTAEAINDPNNQGLVREMRIRTGFTGNVLGFGIKKRLTDTTEVLGYTAVTVGIDSDERRKFSIVRPDWRESFLRITGPWGSFTAGRTLGLFSRGALEITYLYGYRYGLGFPGGITPAGQSTAGSVGFGVLASGFGAGFAYATPSLGGLVLHVGIYDPNNIVATRLLERTRWPRGEYELIFQRTFGATGLVKLFQNGAHQRVYDYDGTTRSADIWGLGGGGRLEIGPVRIGLAGHYGKGIGVDYAMQPHGSLYFVEKAQAPGSTENAKLRNVAGYYAQLMVLAGPKLSLHGGAGITQVFQLPEDQVAWNPCMDPAACDPVTMQPLFAVPSVGFVTIRQQIGLGGGLNVHFTPNVHLALEYFHAYFEWYKPVPAVPGAPNPSQTMRTVNLGMTYDF